MNRALITLPPETGDITLGPSVARKLSACERLWLAADRITPPFVNQMVIEGNRLPEPAAGGKQNFSDIIEQIALAQPGCQVRLGGVLGGCKWYTNGALPQIIRIESDWDGQSPEGAPFLQAPLSVRTGPVFQILMLNSNPARLIFRSHHSVTDGQGTLLFARAFFAALRGAPLQTVPAGPLNDEQVAQLLKPPAEVPRTRSSVAPTGIPEELNFLNSCSREVTWRRRRIEGHFSGLMPKILLACDRFNKAYSDKKRDFWADIPVDLRPAICEFRSQANMTGMIRVPIHLYRDQPPSKALNSLSRMIREKIDKMESASHFKNLRFFHWLPIKFIAALGAGAARRNLRQNRFNTSMTLSNLGLLSKTDFSGGGFKADRIFFIPPGNPGLPLFMTVTGDSEGIELCGSVPASLNSDNQLSSLLEHIQRELVGVGIKTLRE